MNLPNSSFFNNLNLIIVSVPATESYEESIEFFIDKACEKMKDSPEQVTEFIIALSSTEFKEMFKKVFYSYALLDTFDLKNSQFACFQAYGDAFNSVKNNFLTEMLGKIQKFANDLYQDRFNYVFDKMVDEIEMFLNIQY